jgi:hypothetical protein
MSDEGSDTDSVAQEPINPFDEYGESDVDLDENEATSAAELRGAIEDELEKWFPPCKLPKISDLLDKLTAIAQQNEDYDPLVLVRRSEVAAIKRSPSITPSEYWRSDSESEDADEGQ